MWNRLRDRVVRFADRMKLNEKFTFVIVLLLFVPIGLFTVFFFHNMERNTVKEGYKTLEYSLEGSYNEIIKNVDNISMSTQFFLGDKSLLSYLQKMNRGEECSYEEMLQFYNVNISYLERMVNSNPAIYQVRVYVDNQDMEEMMPILYRYERMKRLSWSKHMEISGWKFDYLDTIFDSYTLNQNQRLLALVTPITEYTGEQLGVLEVAVRMDTMFPSVYETDENSVSFFIDNKGKYYCAEENKDFVEEYLNWNSPDANARKAEGTPVLKEQRWKYEKILEGSRYIQELDGTLVRVDNLQQEIGILHRNRNIFLLILLVVSWALVFLINYMVKRLLSQFYRIMEAIREIQKGDLNVVITDCGEDEMGELGTQINTMMERIRELMEDNLNRELLVKNSEIRALQNQINAHFIYNVLESIKMMAEIDEKYDISDAITSLGKLLRYSMRWTSGNVTVEEELEYIKNYLALINLRFDYEIYLSLNLPEIMYHQEIPKMSLQPIVENAIYHGIEQIAEDTNIYVKGWLEKGDCIIEITDSGKGMTEEQVQELYRKISGEIEAGGGSGNGIGLKNVQDRIKISFGENYGLTISSKLGCYTKVSVRVPQTYFEVKPMERKES